MTVNAAVLAERAEIDAVVEGKTIVDSFNRNAETYGDQPAIHWKDGEWRSLTWSEYRDVVHKAAAGLETLGVGDGEFVAIMAGNRPEHAFVNLLRLVLHPGRLGKVLRKLTRGAPERAPVGTQDECGRAGRPLIDR